MYGSLGAGAGLPPGGGLALLGIAAGRRGERDEQVKIRDEQASGVGMERKMRADFLFRQENRSGAEKDCCRQLEG